MTETGDYWVTGDSDADGCRARSLPHVRDNRPLGIEPASSAVPEPAQSLVDGVMVDPEVPGDRGDRTAAFAKLGGERRDALVHRHQGGLAQDRLERQSGQGANCFVSCPPSPHKPLAEDRLGRGTLGRGDQRCADERDERPLRGDQRQALVDQAARVRLSQPRALLKRHNVHRAVAVHTCRAKWPRQRHETRRKAVSAFAMIDAEGPRERGDRYTAVLKLRGWHAERLTLSSPC